MDDIYYIFSITQKGLTIIVNALCVMFLAVMGLVRK